MYGAPLWTQDDIRNESLDVLIRAVESEFKSNLIFSDFPILSDFNLILSDFFRFLDFSRLLDLPIPQL